MRSETSCRWTQREWMLAFDVNRAPAKEAQAHLAHCLDCRAFVAAAERLRQEIRRLPAPEASPSADRQLLTALQEEKHRQSRRRGAARNAAAPVRLAALGAAGAALLLVVLTLFRGSHPPTREHNVEIATRINVWTGKREEGENSKPPNLSAKARNQRKRKTEGQILEKPGKQEFLFTDTLASLWRRPNFGPSPSSRFRDKATFALSPSSRFRLNNAGAEWRSDDLLSLNRDALRDDRQWTPLPTDEWGKIEARVRRQVRVRDDFITIPFPRLASTSDRQIAQAAESYKREAAIVDARLSREVTCAFKATALSDLCDRLRADTGIQLAAGPSVADEKVTVFCEKLPLREVMRQLSRPFGYTWLRSKKEGGEYRYELVQDLRSQLLEEELRNRDRDAALLALDQEMQRYRACLSLSPDEVLALAKTALPPEKMRLQRLASFGWGAVQMYFRLSPRDLAALRAGQEIDFSADPKPGEQPLPPDLQPAVLQSLRDWRVRSRDGRFSIGIEKDSDGQPPAAVPEARAMVTLRLDFSNLGQVAFDAGSGIRISGPTQTSSPSARCNASDALAVGINPSVRNPENRVANARLADDPVLRRRVTVQPETSCRMAAGAEEDPAAKHSAGTLEDVRKVTSADVLEALHRASGVPIVADFYTGFFPVGSVSVKDRSLFEALNRLADAMRLRWKKEAPPTSGRPGTREAGYPRSGWTWLQFRSASYYDDRLKEVPNRLLFRWADSRRQHGGLPLEDLLEIVQLSDAQLDAPEMAESARECFGLTEWSLARNYWLRPHLRYLATLTPAQRQAALTPAGLPFSQLSLPQQQQLIAHLGSRIGSLEELSGACVRAEYMHPGAFRWVVPEVVRREDDDGRTARENRLRAGMFGLSVVQERTREAALEAARRIDPSVDAAQIIPTDLAVGVVYMLVDPQTGDLKLFGARTVPAGARIHW